MISHKNLKKNAVNFFEHFKKETSHQVKSSNSNTASVALVAPIIISKETFFKAIDDRDYETLDACLEDKIHVDVLNEYNETALMIAATESDDALTQYLLGKRANPAIVNNKGHNVVEISIYHQYHVVDSIEKLSVFKAVMFAFSPKWLCLDYDKITPTMQKNVKEIMDLIWEEKLMNIALKDTDPTEKKVKIKHKTIKI
jgi:hypothetical protein